jgi:hypothetical protein
MQVLLLQQQEDQVAAQVQLDLLAQQVRLDIKGYPVHPDLPAHLVLLLAVTLMSQDGYYN